MCINFDQEVQYIWHFNKFNSDPNGHSQNVYIFSSDIMDLFGQFETTPATELSLSMCKHYQAFYIMGGDVLFTTIVNIVLALRLSALYQNNHKVNILLIFIITVELVLELWISIQETIYTVVHTTTAPSGTPSSLTGCITSSPPGKESLISCAALPNVNAELGPSWKKISVLKSISPMFQVFIKDGAIHYLLSNILSPQYIRWIIAIYSFSVFIILMGNQGSRLILNLRATASKNISQSSTWKQTLELQTFVAAAPTHTEQSVEHFDM
ncbi:hypothetical protein F5880DRAFT_1504075 [Lentinula raphanica]|nr:hypothetical protein F5880DRAFT_1504075 [Lentinula raphanica]